MTSCIHACVYRRTSMTSAHFPMLIFKWYFTREWTMQTTALKHYGQRERMCVCVCVYVRVRNTETNPKKTKRKDVGYMMRRRTRHATGIRSATTLTWIPSQRKICWENTRFIVRRTAVWQIVCVYETHFASTYVLPYPPRLFLVRFRSRRETRAEFVSEK